MRVCAHCGSQVPDGAAFCPNCNKLPAGPIAPAKQGSSRSLLLVLGCVLVPVLIAFVGIIAALLIPNFLDALQKAKQKRAVADLLIIGGAIETYKGEHGVLPPATDMASLAAALGTQNGSLRLLDPWQHPYRYECWQEDPTAKGCDHYRVASAGRDGKFEQADLKAYLAAEFDPLEYDHDIVFGDAAFIVRPRGR